jgi:hypothetical protein
LANKVNLREIEGYLSTLNENENFSRRKERMKTVWIGTMAITFVLGTGMVALMYVLGKMILSYTNSMN